MSSSFSFRLVFSRDIFLVLLSYPSGGFSPGICWSFGLSRRLGTEFMRFLLTSYPMGCSRDTVPSSEVQKRCSVPFLMFSVVGLSCKFQFKHVVWYLPSFGEDNLKMTTHLELQ